jgi:hypothetical protein
LFRIQEEREERHKYKGVVSGMGRFVEDAPVSTGSGSQKGESGKYFIHSITKNYSLIYALFYRPDNNQPLFRQLES